jgi:hypothetical protein
MSDKQTTKYIADDFRSIKRAAGYLQGQKQVPLTHPAEKVADLCDALARAADQKDVAFHETAEIARCARDAIRSLIAELERAKA